MAAGKYKQWLTPEGLGLIEAWCREGLEDKELAKAMNISRDTLYTWKKEYSDISDAIARGRAPARELIENALVKMAKGYTVTVMEPMKLRSRLYNQETGKYEEREVVELAPKEVHIPMDVRAAKFWLTNRNRERWSEHPEREAAEDEREPVQVIIDV